MTTQWSGQTPARLREFQEEVARLRLSGGRATPERYWILLSGVAMAAGVVITLVAWVRTHGTESQLDFADFAAMGRFGMALTVAGAAVFAVMSIRRWFRYWLVRLIFELRDLGSSAADTSSGSGS